MSRDGRPIDAVTVADKLKAKDMMEPAEASAFFSDLIDETPTPAHAEYYTKNVMENDLLRRTLDCAQQIEADCYEDDDAKAVVTRAEQAVLDLSSDKSGIKPWAETVEENLARVDAIIEHGGSFAGIPSGYHNMDNILQGFKPGEMVILAARPSMGKTALALNIAERIGLGHTTDHTPRPAAVFSLEMSSDALAIRMLCSHSRVQSHALTKGLISQTHHRRIQQAAQVLSKAPLIIDDTGGLEIETLRARARRMHKRKKIEIIFIDYLQLVRIHGFERRSRNEEVSAISASLKAMAKELNVPVVVLSQLSRAGEKDGQRKPRMSDLRDSGAIEQDADVICLLRRPCKLAKDDENHDEALAIVDVAKHRNGPTGEIRLNFEDQYTRFEDRKEGVDPIPEIGKPGERGGEPPL
jgi:replicative DNA helicase